MKDGLKLQLTVDIRLFDIDLHCLSVIHSSVHALFEYVTSDHRTVLCLLYHMHVK